MYLHLFFISDSQKKLCLVQDQLRKLFLHTIENAQPWRSFPCCSTFSNMPALLLFPRLIRDHQMKNAASNAVKHPRCDISVLVFPICWAAWSDILYAWQPACRHGFQSSTAPGGGGHGYSVPPFRSHADGSDDEDALSIRCIVNHPDSAALPK